MVRETQAEWSAKPVGAMTAEEIVAALDHLARVHPDDVALEKALRGQLARAVPEGHAADGAA